MVSGGNFPKAFWLVLSCAVLSSAALSCARERAPHAKEPVVASELEPWEKGEVDIPDRESCKYCPTGKCEAFYSDPAILRCERFREPPPTN